MFELGNRAGHDRPANPGGVVDGRSGSDWRRSFKPSTFMELLRRRADERAKKTGTTREEVLREFIVNPACFPAASRCRCRQGRWNRARRLLSACAGRILA